MKYMGLGVLYMMGLSGVAVYWQADNEEEERGESGGGWGEYEVNPTWCCFAFNLNEAIEDVIPGYPDMESLYTDMESLYMG